MHRWSDVWEHARDWVETFEQWADHRNVEVVDWCDQWAIEEVEEGSGGFGGGLCVWLQGQQVLLFADQAHPC